MQSELYISKLFKIFLVSVVFAAGLVLFIIFNTQNKPRAITIESDFTEDIKKFTNQDFKTSLYTIDVVLVGDLSFDPVSKNAIGNFYYKSDPNKNAITYYLVPTKDDKYIISTLSDNKDSSSVFKEVTKDELIGLAKDGSPVRMEHTYRLDSTQDLYDSSILDDIFMIYKNAGGYKLPIPFDFMFKASTISFYNI
jgi:hypothetical protein